MRIATFNIENLDETPDGGDPSFEVRAAVLRPALARIDADILCLQEVHGQERPDQPRRLLALQKLLQGTKYEGYKVESTRVEGEPDVYDVRNLVTLIRPEMRFGEVRQIRNDITDRPQYRYVTSTAPDEDVRKIWWQRPLFYTEVVLPSDRRLHVVNVHLKSKIPTDIPGQKKDPFTWRTAAGWAEGYFVSSMKRVGAALEARLFISQLFERHGPGAMIVVCGDFNADTDDVPVAAIRGRVEDTGNGDLAQQVMVPCESSVPESARYSLFHHGRPVMIDHLLCSRAMLPHYRGSEIHNEILPDESVAFASDVKYPESDHAPVIASFDIDVGNGGA